MSVRACERVSVCVWRGRWSSTRFQLASVGLSPNNVQFETLRVFTVAGFPWFVSSDGLPGSVGGGAREKLDW